MLVRVKVNDRGPYLFIVDSGADRSVVGANLAERLELPGGKPATLQTLAGPHHVETVMIDRLGIGDDRRQWHQRSGAAGRVARRGRADRDRRARPASG